MPVPDAPPLEPHNTTLLSSQPTPPADDAAHPPPRSFSQPQFPYHFHPRTNPNSTAPSLREAALTHAHAPHALSSIPHGDLFAPLCASARTSYTRVDAPTVPSTPPPEFADALTPSRYELNLNLVLDADQVEAQRRDQQDEDDEDADEKAGIGRDEDRPPVPQTPQVYLTFLLVTGKRKTMAFDPEMSIRRVKELVWNAWPNDADWQDSRPPAPSYLRILHLGKILQDDDTLSRWQFPVTQPSPSSPLLPQGTIVHLSIRPTAPSGADDALKKRRRRGGSESGDADEEGAGCCACVIC